MKLLACILLFFLGISASGNLYGQEEESAAVSLEANTDEFQECFFEALKQKGIENYDKAINQLLECKGLDPSNTVVDHELAKAYLASEQPLQALEYGIAALQADPANLWYLETLVTAALRQGNTLEMLKGRIPYGNTRLRENLAMVFYFKNDYQAALEVLKDLERSRFSEQLRALVRDSLERNQAEAMPMEKEENPLEAYRSSLQELLEKQDYGALEELSLEALEQFPSYPYFYYARGLVLNHGARYALAASVMEEGLDYLLDDPALAAEMYRALAAAYTGLGNISKANMYLSKIKSGS